MSSELSETRLRELIAKARSTSNSTVRVQAQDVDALVTELLERRSDALRTPSKEGDTLDRGEIEGLIEHMMENNGLDPANGCQSVDLCGAVGCDSCGCLIHKWQRVTNSLPAPPVPDTRSTGE